MNLVKNILFSVFLLGALIAGVWAYLHLKELKKPKEDALVSFPASCSLYLRTGNLPELNNRLNTRNLIVDRFASLSPLKDVLESANEFCKLLPSSPLLEETFLENPVHLGIYNSPKAWLISFNLRELGQDHEFQQVFSATFKAEKLEKGLYAFKLGSFVSLFIRSQNGRVCVSNSVALLERAFNKEVARLEDQEAFKKFNAGVEASSPLSLFVDHKAFGSSQKPHALEFNLLLNEGFSSGDFQFEPSEVTFNGHLLPKKQALLGALIKQIPVPIRPESYLPADAGSFMVYGINDLLSLKKELAGSGAIKPFWDRARDSALYDIESAFYSNQGALLGEFAWGETPQTYLFGTVKDSARAREHLAYMSDSLYQTNGLKFFRLSNSGSSRQLFFPVLSFDCRYACIVGTGIYFSETAAPLLSLAEVLSRHHTMDANEKLMDYYQEQFPETAHVLCYVSGPFFQKRIHEIIPETKKSGPGFFEGLRQGSYSLSGENESYKFRWHCSMENKSEEAGEELLWSAKLDTICNSTPVLFTNHLSGEKEIAVQDEGNTLYLINGKGKILWKKAVGEKINSRIFEVDAFKNRKFQLLFSTEHYLHLVDRNGKEVDNYPVKTPSPLTSALVVFDYEKTGDYRLFFACNNKKIYNYTIDGKQNRGFREIKTSEVVEQPIRYLKVGSSDFLLTIDKEGELLAFSRKGDQRLRLSNRSLVPSPEVYVDISNSLNSTRIVYLDQSNGLLHKISLADKKEIVQLKNSESLNCYSYALVDENRNMDLVLAVGKEVAAYSLNGSTLFETQGPFVFDEISYYSDQNHSVYYGRSKSTAELWFYNQRQNSGKTLGASAMPLFCDLFRNKELYLVYPEKNKLNCLAY